MKGLKRLIPHRKKKEDKGHDCAEPGSTSKHSPAVFEIQPAISPDWADIPPTGFDQELDNRYSTGPVSYAGIPPQEVKQGLDNRYSTGPEFFDDLSSQEEYRKRGSDIDRSLSERSGVNSKRVEISMPEQSFAMQRNGSKRKSVGSTHSETSVPNLDDDAPNVVKAYAMVPLLEQTKLPRGGVSMETQAVGRVQVRLVSLDSLFCFVCSMFSTFSFYFISSGFLRKLSKTACASVCRCQPYTLYRWNDFAGRWGLH